jgi:hypothetical protein
VKERSGHQAFLVRARDGASVGSLRRRLESEAEARLLAVIAGGSVLIAEFDAALRDVVARWPQVQLVGGVNFAGRTIRRIRVDQQGRPITAAPVG